MIDYPPIPSGSNLSDYLKKVAKQLLFDLKAKRERGEVTSKSPATAGRICVAYKQKYGWDLRTEDIRACTNFLRDNFEPIGSNSKGYYYITTLEEYEETLAHLRSRYNGIGKDINRLEVMMTKKRNEDDLFSHHPVIEKLGTEFGAVRV